MHKHKEYMNETHDYKDPHDECQHNQLSMEMGVLGPYECFGEDYKNCSNLLLPKDELVKSIVPYSSVTVMPSEFYAIKKRDFFEYIDDVTRKSFMYFIRRYPSDFELRLNYNDEVNWNNYKRDYIKKMDLVVPSLFTNDKSQMRIIEELKTDNKAKRNKVILPKIDKKA